MWVDVIELTVLAVRERDLDKIIRWEMRRQVRESKDPDQLGKKWKRASVTRRSDDLPRFNLARAARHIFAEIWGELDQSKDPVQLVRKWQQALVSGHLEDLPHIPY